MIFLCSMTQGHPICQRNASVSVVRGKCRYIVFEAATTVSKKKKAPLCLVNVFAGALINHEWEKVN